MENSNKIGIFKALLDTMDLSLSIQASSLEVTISLIRFLSPVSSSDFNGVIAELKLYRELN